LRKRQKAKDDAEIDETLFLFTFTFQRPGWYRYHQLFLQALRRMLEQVHPEEAPALHRRAAQWYLEHQDIGAGLRHLIAGLFWIEAAQVLEEYALSVHSRPGILSCRLYPVSGWPARLWH
jgi:ATP/maltotriose-dependent transcriptional regulator MalT